MFTWGLRRGSVEIKFFQVFDDIDKVYENFIQKVMAIIDNLAASKNKRIKGTSQNWFDPEIMKKKWQGWAISKIQKISLAFR